MTQPGRPTGSLRICAKDFRLEYRRDRDPFPMVSLYELSSDDCLSISLAAAKEARRLNLMEATRGTQA